MLSETFFEALKLRYPAVGPTVVLTFSKKPDDRSDILRFITMTRSGVIAVILEDTPIAKMQAAILSAGYQDWQRETNHVFRVRFPLGEAFTQKEFIGLRRGITSLMLLKKHPLSDLMTGRQKKQQEQALRIIAECLTDSVTDTVHEMGLDIDADLDLSIKELPGIRFSYRLDGQVIHSVLLDSWSGRILIDKMNSDSSLVFQNAEQVRGILIREIATCVEKV